MPELPEVETAVRSLRENLEGKIIESVHIIHSYPLKYTYEEDFINMLETQRIESISRRGKYMLIQMRDDGTTDPVVLMVHLGMTGALIYKPRDDSFSQYTDSIRHHIFVKLNLSCGGVLFYSDYRRFGSMRTLRLSNLKKSPKLAPSHLKSFLELGAEPFEEGAVGKFLTEIRKKRYANKPIKDVLLDQRVLAGAGNIYASEACHDAGIYPHRSVDMLTDSQLTTLFYKVRDVLALSIEYGGSSIKDYVDGSGKSGSFQNHLKVYNQHSCGTCDSRVILTYIKDRATYHCPHCQS